MERKCETCKHENLVMTEIPCVNCQSYTSDGHFTTYFNWEQKPDAPIDHPFDVVAEAVYAERQFQDNKWGNINEHGHTLGEWLLIAEAELAEAKTALIKGGEGRDSLRSEITQTIAVLFACLEQHGTNDPHKERQV
jgi:hypothetical protein